MNRVEAAGISFYTSIDGPDGAPWIVLSNSLGSNFGMWNEQLDLLTRKYRVLRYDHRGHGGTDVPAGPYSWDQLTGDVVALMDALGIDTADYMGLSMGLMTGLGLGINHGSRFGKMVLCDGRANAPEPFKAMWDQRMATIREDGMSAMAKAMLPMWLSEEFRTAHPERTSELQEMIAGTDPAGYIACCQALQTLDYLKDAGRITNKVLCITGTKDMGAPPDVVKDIAATIPNASYAEIDGAHHLANVNAPEAFNAIISEFLDLN